MFPDKAHRWQGHPVPGAQLHQTPSSWLLSPQSPQQRSLKDRTDMERLSSPRRPYQPCPAAPQTGKGHGCIPGHTPQSQLGCTHTHTHAHAPLTSVAAGPKGKQQTRSSWPRRAAEEEGPYIPSRCTGWWERQKGATGAKPGLSDSGTGPCNP